MVSETSFKFFVQFVFWAAIYCIFNLAVMGCFAAESRKKVSVLSFMSYLFAAHIRLHRHTKDPRTQDLKP